MRICSLHYRQNAKPSKVAFASKRDVMLKKKAVMTNEMNKSKKRTCAQTSKKPVEIEAGMCREIKKARGVSY